MMNSLLVLQMLIFSFTLWFGLYLLARDLRKQGLRYAGLGLVSYALGLAWSVLAQQLTIPSAQEWRLIPIVLPSLFWMASTWYLSPETTPTVRFGGGWGVLLLMSLVLLILTVALNLISTQIILVSVPVLFLAIAIWKVRQVFQSSLPRSPLITLITATLFFLLGTGLLIIPLDWLSSEWVLLGISVDLIFLGAILGYLDAYEEGTNLLGDAFRSWMASALVAVIFAGQVALIIGLSGTESPYLIALLFMVIATAIALETFSGIWQSALDRLIFVDKPHLQKERDVLRAVNAVLPRINPPFDWQKVDEAEFARLTRRALSHFNDLDKLASSPLIHLPAVTRALHQQQTHDTVLERTHALKALLAESILKLKPYSDHDFDAGDAWRFYNVLYFPYLRGLKPYSPQRAEWDDATRSAWEWFQTQVPERTLYNWQTTASRLIAQHLRDIQPKIEPPITPRP